MTRREFLAVSAASIGTLDAWPAFAAEDADLSLRMVLDSFIADDTPTAKIARLETVDAANLSPGARLDRDVVLGGLRHDAALAELLPASPDRASLYIVSPFAGRWRHPVAPRSETAAAALVASETEAIRTVAAAGIVLPRQILERTIAVLQARANIVPAPVANAIWRQCAQLVALRSQASRAPGVWHLPQGEAIFEAMLRRQFGGSVSPADLHARFIEEIGALGGRINDLLRRQGLVHGSIGARLAAFYKEPRWLYSDDDAGRDRAVTDMNHRLDIIVPRLALMFRDVPRDAADICVRRMTPSEEAAGRSGFRAVPGRGESGGYVVDLRDIRRRPSWSLASVAYHELLPGHMMQLIATDASGSHPLRAQYAGAMTEGWAVYGEQLAADDGVFEGDDPAMIGHLHWLMFRLCRGMIDTGIHHLRWSTAKARRMLELIQGEPAYFASFDQDIAQVAVNPGVRAAEALSWLELVRLQRGSSHRNDLCRFHDSILEPGPMPLPILAARLDNYQ